MLPEVQIYLERIDDLRNQVRNIITGLPVEALNWKPLEGIDDHATNSLAILVTHTAGAEHFWIAEVVGESPPIRVRDEEFKTIVMDETELLQKLDIVKEETREVLTSLTLDELEKTRIVRDRIVPVRWAILHVVDHTALHLGHMQLTYQLLKGGKGVNAPRWFKRIQKETTD